jgi:Na+/proline symporter
MESIGTVLGLSDTNLVTVVVRLVNLALGFLPLVAVIFVILGGLQWMTSGGDEEKVGRAKRTISSAIIGIVVVLLAWAIVQFIAKTTLNVSQG